MELSIRPMTEEERMYSYTQSGQIRSMTGNIGYLQADMGDDGHGFFSSWNSFSYDWKMSVLGKEFDYVIDYYREYAEEPFLKSLKDMETYCLAHPEAAFNNERNEFGVRVDSDTYSYLMRLNPGKGENNLYCYCYQKQWLDRHLKEAERGIRFITSNYDNLFWLKDGGTIQITWPDGIREEKTCRYIDSTHLEVGTGPLNIYHICEFAERMEGGNAKVEPLNGLISKREERRMGYAR